MRNSLGEWLEEVTKSRGWSGNELARQAGVDSGTVSRIKTGKTFPHRETIEKICAALGRDPAEAYAELLEREYILVRRELLTEDAQEQIRRLLLNRRAGREIKELLRAIMAHVEKRES